MSKPQALALIPLRGGSKSIPKKNIKSIAGRPLFYWVTKACLDSALFEKVVVSTDCDEIAAAVRAQFAEDVEVLKRPAELASDTSSTESVMMHFAENFSFDVLCTVQATSPLLKSQDLKNGWQTFLDGDADSLLSAVRWKRFFWTEDGRPVNYDPKRRPRRQEFDGWLMENGAFYFTKRSVLLQEMNRLGGKISVAEMPEESAIEIDEPLDWLLVENLLLRQK